MLLPTVDNLGLYKARICQVQSLLWNSKRVAVSDGSEVCVSLFTACPSGSSKGGVADSSCLGGLL